MTDSLPPPRQIAFAFVPSPDHVVPDHPENPHRFDDFGPMLGSFPEGILRRIEPEPAPEDLLHVVHPPSYLRALREACLQGPAIIDYAPTFVTPSSYADAVIAAGAVSDVAAEVWERRSSAGFALVRPPGHHATRTRAMGFCLINNIAVAVRHVQSLGCERLLIVDIDVHHGNGTQAIFEADPDVLYISSHQYGIYPGTGSIDEIGSGDGSGTVVNVPLPSHAGDKALLMTVERVVSPLAHRFRPQMLLVSAGFDTHWRDPLANLLVSCAGVYRVVRRLAEIADAVCAGRMCLTLEGGYDPQALGGCVQSALCAAACLPQPTDPLGPAPYDETDVEGVMAKVRAIHGV